MIDGVGLERVDKREIVDHLSRPGEKISHPTSGLTLLREAPMRGSNRKACLTGRHPGKWLIAADRIGQIFIV